MNEFSANSTWCCNCVTLITSGSSHYNCNPQTKKLLTRASKRMFGTTERGAWRGVGRKGHQRVGERLTKGWQSVGEGLGNSRNAPFRRAVCDSMEKSTPKLHVDCNDFVASGIQPVSEIQMDAASATAKRLLPESKRPPCRCRCGSSLPCNKCQCSNAAKSLFSLGLGGRKSLFSLGLGARNQTIN